MTGKERFGDAVESFDRANAADPNTESDGERERPQALLYAERMTRWLERLTPDASEPLRLAARSQHLQRWRVPRANFPMDRAEYHKWRTTLMRFHAERAGEILEAVGHDRETVTRLQALLRKEGLLGARPSDPDAQTPRRSRASPVSCFSRATSPISPRNMTRRSSSGSSARRGTKCHPATAKRLSPSTSHPWSVLSSRRPWSPTRGPVKKPHSAPSIS